MPKLTVIELIRQLEPLSGLTTNITSIGAPYYDPSGTPVGVEGGNNAVELLTD